VLFRSPHAFALERACKHGAATVVIELDRSASREAHDEKIVAAMHGYGVDPIERKSVV